MGEYKPLKIKKTADFAVEAICEMITDGRLNPGDKLPPERELAKRFGISMTSLREALARLEGYGHISKKRGPDGGARILDLSDKQELNRITQKLTTKGYTVKQLFQLVYTVLLPVFESATDLMTSEHLTRLKDISKKQQQEFETHGGSNLSWIFNNEVVKILDNPVHKVFVELLTMIMMEKEFTLGIDVFGSSAEIRDYNKKAVQWIADFVRAFEEKDKTLFKTTFKEVEKALQGFEAKDRLIR